MNACDLFDPARLPARGEDGRLTHPDLALVVFVEDEVDVAPFFNGAGLELRSVAHEWPEDDHGGVDLSWVTPEAPAGDGWRLVSIHDTEDGEAIVWWTRYIGPASSSARIVGARVIDGVHVIVAQPASRLLPEQLLVRYDDYLTSRLVTNAMPAPVPGNAFAALLSADREYDEAHADRERVEKDWNAKFDVAFATVEECTPLYEADQRVKAAVAARSDALEAVLAQDRGSQGGVAERVLSEVKRELQRAVAKFPTWPTDPLHASGVVMEESGELAKAVLQAVYEPHKATVADVRAEAVQTAAMAIRFVQSLDADAYSWTPGEQHIQSAAPSTPTQGAPAAPPTGSILTGAMTGEAAETGAGVHAWSDA